MKRGKSLDVKLVFENDVPSTAVCSTEAGDLLVVFCVASLVPGIF